MRVGLNLLLFLVRGWRLSRVTTPLPYLKQPVFNIGLVVFSANSDPSPYRFSDLPLYRFLQ
jgi:hypothetical protein